MNPKYKEFFDWFHETEAYALRSERFHEDLKYSGEVANGPMYMVEWLYAAFQAGQESK